MQKTIIFLLLFIFFSVPAFADSIPVESPSDFIQWVQPEFLGVVAVLFGFGMILKNTEAVKDKLIPVWLAGFGVVLITAISFINGVGFDKAILTGIQQGILSAAAAVYGKNLWKQLIEKKNE